MKDKSPQTLHSISQLHTLLKIRKPAHPLVSVLKAEEIDAQQVDITEPVVFNFYVVSIKTNCAAKIRYGQQFYDFDEGVMTFLAPRQRIEIEATTDTKPQGYMLVFHPDFLHGYPLAKKIKGYGYFSYEVNEALHLSDKELCTILCRKTIRISELPERHVEKPYRSNNTTTHSKPGD